MTNDEMLEMEKEMYWDAERQRRLAHIRRQRIADNAELIQNIVLILLGIIAGAIILYLHVTQPTRERTAYLEGRYGLDHATALAMARDGFGKTAEEILKEVR